MKITFEDENAKVVMEIPGIAPRKDFRPHPDIACWPIEATVEAIDKNLSALATFLMTNVQVNKEGDKAPLLRMVLVFLSQVDPGTPVDIWDILAKMQKK